MPDRYQTIRTLLGETTLGVSLACLPTLIQYNTDPIRLVVHEDGTLTDASRDLLSEALPGVEIIDRSRADEAVLPSLDHHPMCRAARKASPLFLKLFDIALMEQGETLLYCDSDVLFLRPFRGVFGESRQGFAVCFMHDTKSAYAVRPWDLWPLGRIRLASMINTGLIRAAPEVLDLDFLEWLLARLVSQPVWGRRWYWAEQTCWAALAARVPCGLWDRQHVVLADSEMTGYSELVVAIHFVSTYRNRLAQFQGRAVPPVCPPVMVSASTAGQTGPLEQLLSDLRGRYRSPIDAGEG